MFVNWVVEIRLEQNCAGHSRLSENLMNIFTQPLVQIFIIYIDTGVTEKVFPPAVRYIVQVYKTIQRN